jgi:hypothetical protein
LEVGLWMGKGVRAYRSQPNRECQRTNPRSEPVGDNLHGREGNNPDHRLRSLSEDSVGKDVGLQKQPGGWLRSSHPLKSA